MLLKLENTTILIIFESLDYFEEAFSHEDGGKYPDINNYR